MCVRHSHTQDALDEAQVNRRNSAGDVTFEILQRVWKHVINVALRKLQWADLVAAETVACQVYLRHQAASAAQICSKVRLDAMSTVVHNYHFQLPIKGCMDTIGKFVVNAKSL